VPTRVEINVLGPTGLKESRRTVFSLILQHAGTVVDRKLAQTV